MPTASTGWGSFSTALFWIGSILGSGTSPCVLMPPILLLGVANGFMWAPISSRATRNLPLHHAGAGAGVYNTVRQVGAVFGSAAIAVVMEARLSANIGDATGTAGGSGVEAAGGMAAGTAEAGMPEAIATGFAHAMGQSLWLPAELILIGFVAVLFFERPKPRG